jgi:hypothetical protein
LDEKCFRREINYHKKGKKYYSHIIDNVYSKKDLFEKLSDFELNKLENMNFNVVD